MNDKVILDSITASSDTVEPKGKGAADEAVLIKVHIKNSKIPPVNALTVRYWFIAISVVRN